ncbi:hypothetical protein ACSDQ9_05725 [Aestuariimicrobium soli]|uniref:hypothetical protein n=1 Tax=Aestuariimicrobium soli TaxID=2035834 RepID=UPI003EB7104E
MPETIFAVEQPDGTTFRGCSCLVEWWPIVQRLAVARGLVQQQLDVSQGGYNRGGVAASAGTHDGGGVLDLRQYSDGVIRLLRELGAAAWHRTPAQGFIHHTHLVLVGCPHVSSGAAAQVVQYRQGLNGLAGRGPDDGPQVTIRTYSEGVAVAAAELAVLAITDLEDHIMSMSDADRAKLIDDIAAATAKRVMNYPIGRETVVDGKGKTVPLTFVRWLQTVLYGIKPGTGASTIGRIAKKLGVEA